MKPVTFSDYANRYECVSMKRVDGILLLTIHAPGAIDKTCVWSAKPHEELSYAFNDIARDRENLCVIITGAGGAFCAEMHPSIAGLARFSEGNVSSEMFERMDQAGHDGRHLLINHLNIEVPMIAAVNGPALIHAELAVLCDIVLAAEEAEFSGCATSSKRVGPRGRSPRGMAAGTWSEPRTLFPADRPEIIRA